MAQLEELTKGALVEGVIADGAVNVVDVTWHGSEVLTPLIWLREAVGGFAARLTTLSASHAVRT